MEITAETQFVSETLVTDTVTYEIVGRTPKGLKLRGMRHGEMVKREMRGGPMPCDWDEAVSDSGGREFLVKLRKDGTYRIGGGRPLRPATMVNGKPTFYTDYRM